jgi:hypothetical protein
MVLKITESVTRSEIYKEFGFRSHRRTCGRKFEVSLEVVCIAALPCPSMDIFGEGVVEIENVRPVISFRNSDDIALECHASDSRVIYCNSFELVIFVIGVR